jgi:Protein of unknown function (DUF3105)
MRRRLLLVMVTSALLTACGATTLAPGITVQFVGNSTCPAAGQNPYSPLPPNTNGPPVGQPVNEMPHIHVTQGVRITYEHDPPTSGCHYILGFGVAPIAPGIYPPSNAAKLTAEYWVHNLEHGYIVVSYNCPTGCDGDLQKLNAWYKTLPPDPGGGVPYAKFIAVPYPQQKERWDVEAWDWFDPLGSTLNLTEIKKFYDNHVNQAPEGARSA